jgi:hypothetical protein
VLPAPLGLAVEIDRVVPASGNLAVRGQQFWLGPDRAGTPVTLWADTTVVHLFLGGHRLKSLASRLSADDLRRCWPTADARLGHENGQPANQRRPMTDDYRHASGGTRWVARPA